MLRVLGGGCPSCGAARPLSDEAALVAKEAELDEWASDLEAQARELFNQRAAAKAARAAAASRRECEEELMRWTSELELQVRRATGQLEMQKREQVELCAQFDQSISANMRKLEQMQLDVRRRAAALDVAYNTCIHRIHQVCAEAVQTRRSTLRSAAPPPSLPPTESLPASPHEEPAAHGDTSTARSAFRQPEPWAGSAAAAIGAAVEGSRPLTQAKLQASVDGRTRNGPKPRQSECQPSMGPNISASIDEFVEGDIVMGRATAHLALGAWMGTDIPSSSASTVGNDYDL
uniref:Uncharacterized protein n=1 Tax=Calcidiscus leptoporus TaxID=127549 RepID=A0A7S0JIT9_9EUKA|mmetsp:Transcript_650/g.1469  ORF Transcript_650/g.1469 Transcript_650/m.1469 type:complete len:290 (+) Transcript_650:65-934(+)